MSTKFKALDGSQLIELELFARTDEKTLPGDLKLTSGKAFEYYQYIGEPLETTVFWQIRADFENRFESKCLTFFNHVEKGWTTFQAQLEALTIKRNLDAVYRSTPFNTRNYISILSPNYLPDFDFQTTFTEIYITDEINIKYCEHRIHRLGEGYDTDCYDYESDNRFGYNRMKSDCVSDCYQDKLRKLCKVDHGIFMSHSLIRKEYLIGGNERLLSCYDLKYNRENFFVKQDCH